jgi:2-oxoisovalerate dehydrogenase E1 component alpha subunit
VTSTLPASTLPASPSATPGAATTSLLPSAHPLALIAADGTPITDSAVTLPSPEIMGELYRRMVIGRRFDSQATALTKQGRLAVYPSSRGQEACEIGSVLALRAADWLFPTYRDSVALVSRDIDPVEVLSLLRGEWHCGYDPYRHNTAPQCTPLATNTLHAVGFAYAATLKNESTVALVLLGDGATSEGDTHEALNFAAVWKAPVVFLVQNNGYAISVPLSKQTAAPTLAHKGIGYGIPGTLVDGNDAGAVYSVVRTAIENAACGNGPALIEAVTYRMEAHTNADDATRYRDAAEVAGWAERDPIVRLDRYLRNAGHLDDERTARISAEADRFADEVRRRMNTDAIVDPAAMFEHVYSTPTPQLRNQLQDVLTRADSLGPDGRYGRSTVRR